MVANRNTMIAALNTEIDELETKLLYAFWADINNYQKVIHESIRSFKVIDEVIAVAIEDMLVTVYSTLIASKKIPMDQRTYNELVSQFCSEILKEMLTVSTPQLALALSDEELKKCGITTTKNLISEAGITSVIGATFIVQSRLDWIDLQWRMENEQ